MSRKPRLTVKRLQALHMISWEMKRELCQRFGPYPEDYGKKIQTRQMGSGPVEKYWIDKQVKEDLQELLNGIQYLDDLVESQLEPGSYRYWLNWERARKQGGLSDE